MKPSSPLLIVLLLAAGSTLYAAEAQKPNIVVILADDLGYGDVQCNNPDRGKIPTPNIDKLAVQGMRFTDGHSSSGVCTPSRYTLLTGRYNCRTHLQRSVLGGMSPPVLAPDRLIIASLLKQQGCTTACVCKWHLGMTMPQPLTEGTIHSAWNPRGQIRMALNPLDSF